MHLFLPCHVSKRRNKPQERFVKSRQRPAPHPHLQLVVPWETAEGKCEQPSHHPHPLIQASRTKNVKQQTGLDSRAQTESSSSTSCSHAVSQDAFSGCSVPRKFTGNPHRAPSPHSSGLFLLFSHHGNPALAQNSNRILVSFKQVHK